MAPAPKQRTSAAAPASTLPFAGLPSDVLLLVALQLPISSLILLSSTSKDFRSLLYKNRALAAQWLRAHAGELEAVVEVKGRVGRWDSLDFGLLSDERAFVRHEVCLEVMSRVGESE
jgi:hypothetical protein